MNNNIIPSAIIAASILISGFIVKYEIDQKTTFSTEKILNEIDGLAVNKDKDGNSRIKKSISNFISEISSGIKQGFDKGMSQDSNGFIEGLNDIEIAQIKFIEGRMDNEEKIIAIIRNKGKLTISDVELNVSVKDRNGILIDVISSFARVEGVLLPGSELGISVDRSIGRFGADKEKMDGNKGSTAEIKIAKMKIIK